VHNNILENVKNRTNGNEFVIRSKN